MSKIIKIFLNVILVTQISCSEVFESCERSLPDEEFDDFTIENVSI